MTPKHSHRIKFNRAQEHLKDLKVHIADWRQSEAHSFRLEPDPSSPEHCLLKGRAAPIPHEDITPILGDAIQNLRASLDHIVFALVEKHVGRPLEHKVAKICEFPIVGGNDKVTGHKQFLEKKIVDPQFLSQDARTEIERLQPYHGEMPSRLNAKGVVVPIENAISKLNYLSNVDKHRSLHVVVAYTGGVTWNPKIPNSTTSKSGVTTFGGNPMERGTPILRLPVELIDRSHEVEVDIKKSLEVAFRHGPAWTEDVEEVLAGISHFLIVRVFPALEPLL